MDEPLKVEAVGGRLVISIGQETLAHAVQVGFADRSIPYRVSDPAALLKSVAAVLDIEEEDGSTRVHRLLDEAAGYALDYGQEGFEEAPLDTGRGCE